MRKQLLLLLLLLALATTLAGCFSDGGSWKGEASIPTVPLKGNLYLAGWLRKSSETLNRKQSFFASIDLFNEINPVWYDVTIDENDDDFKDTYTTGIELDVLQGVAGKQVKVIPTIQNVKNGGGVAIVNDLIGTPEARKAHVGKLVELVAKNGYDGIDIDYEGKGIIRQNFTDFICLLSQELAQTNKVVSVCVGIPGAYEWQDWLELLKYVDSLKVMVYDCDITDNPVPAAICRMSALKETLNYAAKLGELAKGKIIIGLPLYGRDWWPKAGESGYEKQAKLYIQTKALRDQLESAGTPVEVKRSTKDWEPYFSYTDDQGVKHTAYFQDAFVLNKRLDAINSYGYVVKGVTFWDLGGEDEESWKAVQLYK